jgi:uncharacterized protein YndB with AHSA1/START domain
MDEDLDRLTRDQLVDAVAKLRHGIRAHRDSSRHELCWHHPALWGLLPEKTDPVPVVPDWPQFLQGCLRYRQSLDEQAPHAPRTREPYRASDLYHQVWIEASSAKVYEAIATDEGVGRWWDRPTTVQSPQGVVLEFSPGAEHGVLRARRLEMVPDRRVVWEFFSTHPQNSPASAWTGTRVTFEISRRPVPPWAAQRVDTAILDFRHSGWDEGSEYLGFCNFHWAEALNKLKQWCESS